MAVKVFCAATLPSAPYAVTRTDVGYWLPLLSKNSPQPMVDTGPAKSYRTHGVVANCPFSSDRAASHHPVSTPVRSSGRISAVPSRVQ